MARSDTGPIYCGARTRTGSVCDRAPEPGRRRCRIHGGAMGSGAPSGSRNGRYVSGNYTKEAKAERRLVRSILEGCGGRADMQNGSEIGIAIGPPAAPGEDGRRVSAQVYKVEGTVKYRTRPPPGTTKKAWSAALKKALGSSSAPFVGACLKRLISACTLPGQGIPTSTGVSAALALIESMKPEDELQAALAVDVACLHAAVTKMLSRVSYPGTESGLTMA